MVSHSSRPLVCHHQWTISFSAQFGLCNSSTVTEIRPIRGLYSAPEQEVGVLLFLTLAQFGGQQLSLGGYDCSLSCTVGCCWVQKEALSTASIRMVLVFAEVSRSPILPQ